MVHKHLPYDDLERALRKQEVLGIELATLASDSADEFPLVVTSHLDNIKISWWRTLAESSTSSGTGAGTGVGTDPSSIPIPDPSVDPGFDPHWRTLTIPHEELLLPEGIPESLKQLASRNYSQRVGVAISRDSSKDQYVFLMYKRTIVDATDGSSSTGLFLTTLHWRKDTQLLSFDGQMSLPFPIGGNRGYSLWLGFSNPLNRLILLSQVFTDSDQDLTLEMFFVDLQPLLLYPEEASSWQSQMINLPINQFELRGIDLNARLDGDKLSFIYNPQNYTMVLSDPRLDFSQNESPSLRFSSLAEASVNPNLHLQIRSIRDGALLEFYDDVPGGFSPDIQNLDPLYITCDRITEGSIKLTTHPNQSVAMPRFDVLNCEKILIRRMGNGSFSNIGLMYVDGLQHPRHVRTEANQIAIRIVDKRIYVNMIHSLLPTKLCAIQNDGRGSETLDFIHHSIRDNSVTHFNLQLFLDSANLTAGLKSSQILDIGHSQLREHSDNLQFRPFATGFLFPEVEAEDSFIGIQPTQTPYHLDNTLGGLITIDPNNPSLTNYAYIGLGDGGCRVIWHTQAPPDNLTIDELAKIHNPHRVSGSNSPNEKWIELFHDADSSLSNYIPGYEIFPIINANPRLAAESTVASGLNLILAQLLGGIELAIQDLRIERAAGENFNTILVTNARIQQVIQLYDFFDTGVQSEDIWAILTGAAEILGELDFIDSFLSLEIRITNFKLNYTITPIGEVTNIMVTIFDKHDGTIRFVPEVFGQGKIECSTGITYTLGLITLMTLFEELVTINSITVRLKQQMNFSPCVLTSEKRVFDVFTNAEDANPKELTNDRSNSNISSPAALSAKPISTSWLNVEFPEVSLVAKSLSPNNTGIFLTVLVLLGLSALVVVVAGLLISLSLPAVIGAAAFISIILTGLFYLTFPPILALIVRGAIQQNLVSRRQEINTKLDQSYLLIHAGEGIAEGIARMVLQHPDVNEDLDIEGASGRNRFRANFWQTIFVSAVGKCRVLIRK
ncbi:MAG: hypothetical protein O2971_12315 [Proteobacteria bacterium]|nr:hypothetical protein [Pseudomonadota bacterium]